MARSSDGFVGGCLLAALMVPMSASVALAAPSAERRVQVVGQVVDVAGRPVASALVSLRGSVGLVVTDAEGKFALDQPAGGGGMLVISAPGFVTRELEGSAGGRIVLEAVPVYEAAFGTPARDAGLPAAEAPVQAFPTRLGVGLAVRQWAVLRDGEGVRPARAVTGTSLNLLDAGGQVRLGQFLVGLSTSRVKTKIDVGGLLVQPEPQPSVEETVVSLSAGPVFGDAVFEWSPSLVWTGLYTQVSNAGTPWTGTALDFAQNRQGLGLALDAGTVLFGATLRAGVGYMPLQSVSMPSAPYGVSDFRPVSLQATLALPLQSSLDLELFTVRRFAASPALSEAVQDYRLGVAYRPDRGGR